ncbi:protein tweety homolog 2 isoform X1 [Hyaena hyaena]|uniref:protein tweety homolog 2 isoform X1 n=2 Tax=Hyaena hyaena TaxID=95912 RepID=UPI001924E94A|nr:protein tweety homolog 2 isoform X1 [Hyaena hyaena]XP_039085733.1 protein tweety homolog 2 isoform X1 [Hyaena hyaena]XP_039085734.1 protein tweety homolog 2 isoform X1 [Hyaena hyaena]
MLAARVEYVAPWWVAWLHSVPHLGLRLQPVDSTFNPRDESYRESLMFLGLLAAVCLGLNLIFLAAYVVCACCCRRDEAVQTKRHNSCCVTWTAVVAGLICCAAVGVGFYGNSETGDGVYQLIYALDNANHTFSGIDVLVSGTTQKMKVDLEQHLARLSEILAARSDYIQTLNFMQQMAGNVIVQLSGLPAWREVTAVLTEVADQTTYVEYYRWLSYLLLFILDLLICLVTCLGLARRSRGLLASMLCCGVLAVFLSWTSLAADTAAAVSTSDFCSAPDTFILNVTEDHIRTEVTRYYLYCSQSVSSPFQQALTVFQRSLTTMQIQVAGLLQFAVPLFPTAEKDLLGIQLLLNSSESGLHQLTAMLDCRGLHKDYLDALAGICYDGIEGLLYLGLFSLLAALAFSTMICTGPRAWKHFTTRDRDYDDIDGDDPFNPQARRIATHNPPRGQLRSFCSYSSGLGSQTSLQPPAQTISNAPVSEYMNQAMLFGGNPRYENVPLIGRGSPPPTYSPSMRATYLSVADEHLRHYGNEFPA